MKPPKKIDELPVGSRGRCRPRGLALTYVAEETYRFRVGLDRFGRQDRHPVPWVFLYIGRKRAWDCNTGFFATHFTLEEVKEAA